MGNPFVLIAPATRGLSLALARHFLRRTSLPVYATYRSRSANEVHQHILSPLQDVDHSRLKLFPLDLQSEFSIMQAASAMADSLPRGAFLQTGFFTGGILYPEKKPDDIDLAKLQETFQINVLSHLLLIKHFSRFLPDAMTEVDTLSKWVHVSARVGSISDNTKGGWYSYRSSKAALNQVIRTFDNQLRMRKTPSICVGVHPGTMKTDLSKEFWASAKILFEPEEAARAVVSVVSSLAEEQRGCVWDYAGRRVPW